MALGSRWQPDFTMGAMADDKNGQWVTYADSEVLRRIAYLHGVLKGYHDFSYWEDGKQYVGRLGLTLKSACCEVKAELFKITGNPVYGE